MKKTIDTQWARFKFFGDYTAKDDLILQYLPLVNYVLERTKTRLPRELKREDIQAFGVVGLIEAIERFQIDRGTKFETFAIARIRGAIFDQLRQYDMAPRSLRRKARALADVFMRLEERLGREPTQIEAAGSLGISVDTLDRHMVEVSRLSLVSLDSPMTGSASADPGEQTIGSQLVDQQSPDPSARYEIEETREKLVEVIHKLNNQQRTVISLYYYSGLTLREVSKVLDLSESRVTQIRAQALIRLRGHIASLAPISFSFIPVLFQPIRCIC